MSKLIRSIVLGLLLIPGLLHGHYVHISLYNAPEGYLSTPKQIVPSSFGKVIRVTDDYRLYTFMLHEDTETLILFAPDNDWDRRARNLTQSEFVKHRDEYILAKFENMPVYDGTTASYNRRSKFIADSFSVFFDKLVKLHPESEFGLSFRGHGSGGGELMGYRIMPPDVFTMLKSWNRSLGRKLLSIDMSWPCKKGSFSDLVTFSPFTKYYLATDLNQGGFSMDEWTHEKYKECNPPIWLELGDGKPYLEFVENELVRERRTYLYSRQTMIEKQTRQSLTCFDCEKFIKFAESFHSNWKYTKSYGLVDVKQYIREQVSDNENLLQLYDDCIIGTINNKDFFEWSEDANGMYKYNIKRYRSNLVSVDELDNGTIELFPNSTVFQSGSEIEVVATPRPGYVFNGWTGDIEGNYSSGSLVIDEDTFISASFIPVGGEDVEVTEEEVEVTEEEVEVTEEEVEVTEEVIVQHPNFFRWDWLTGHGYGWYTSHWFGTFYNDKISHWVFHVEHGWLYRVGYNADSIWFWDSKLGWLWTSKDMYPYFYSTSRVGWIAYKTGTKNPRLFYDFKSGTWEAH